MTRRGTAPATVHDVLATLVDGVHLDRLHGEGGPRYRRVGIEGNEQPLLHEPSSVKKPARQRFR